MSASRREFAKRIAAVAVAVPLLDSTTVAAQPAQTPTEPPPGSQNIRFAEAQTDVLRARYGQHLTPDDTRKLEVGLDGTARYMQRMREFELHNWDEPDTIFFAMEKEAE